MGLPTAPSSGSGELTLPELPEGTIDVKLVHPDFAPAFVGDFPLKSGAVGNVAMHPGVKLTLHIEAADNGKPSSGLTFNLQHEPYDHPSTIDGPLPQPGPDGTIQLTVAAGKYAGLSITHRDFIVTPHYETLLGHGLTDGYECFNIVPGADQFAFQLHRKVKLRGRVVREGTRMSLANTFVLADLRTPTQDGPFARFALKWTQAGFANTDDRGEFELDLAAGHARLQVADGGFVLPTRYLFEVAPEKPTVVPDIIVKAMPKVRGIVRDQSGKPLAGAVIRFRNSELLSATPMVLTDAEGRFELAPPYIPADWKTDEPQVLQTVVAFHPYEPLSGDARVDLQSASSRDNTAIQMRPQAYDALIDSYPADHLAADSKDVTADERERLSKMSLVGKPAPELDGAAWLNTAKPKMSLADIRGEYLLLQVWATWCGPCHYDMPSVKLVNQLYKNKGLVVIGIHDNSMPVEDVKSDAEKNGLTYPIVVDHPDGRLLAAYRGHGFSGYPSYILIGPDGRIVKDDETVPGPSLRSFKVDQIRQYLMGIGGEAREAGKSAH
jgi:thiol-disulfide isomerase/thioredoxin